MDDAKRRLDDQKFGIVSESDRTAASKSARPSPVRSSLCAATEAPTKPTCRFLCSSLVQDEPDFLDLDAPSSTSAPTTTNNGSPQLSNAYPSPPPSPPLDPSSSETAATSKQLEDGNIPTKEVPYSVDPEKANIAQETTSAGIPFPSADDGDIPVDSALDAQVEAEVLRSYSVRFSRASLITPLNKADYPRSWFSRVQEAPEPAAHPGQASGAGGEPSSSTHFAKSLRLSSQQLVRSTPNHPLILFEN